LLTVDDPVPGWVAITNYEKNKPKYKEEISALGFNNGAPGSSTREMIKGYINPETLERLIPPKDRREVEKNKIPKIDLPIYYMNGSLLPGFSGAPIVNSKGTLVGIGDGGLENGASSVSWVIPATFLDDLKNSPVKELPANLSKSSQLHSAELDIVENYAEVKYKQFSFVKTKTRTFTQLLETAENPDELKYALSVFEDFTVDYNSFKFDIYEDSRYGLVITIPAGSGLAVTYDDDGTEILSTTGNIYGEDAPYDIDFLIEQPEEVATDAEAVKSVLNALADLYFKQLNEDEIDNYVEEENYRIIEDYGNGKFILRTEFNDFENEKVDTRGVHYITFATDSQIYFLSRCVLDRFDDEFENIYDKYETIDCNQGSLNSEQQEVCRAVKEMLQIMTSVHLTSFSNKISAN